ncbi:universal stress protein [Phragmitibacter flavus]|uniref:Universal stress protein n=1 Tax=Phragmitibacter flavus TaxID=2576071 RepID=A0A5R8KES9_9BACT|nr:universal stress protein [Phragmitibacter flavus]TLD70800.1 universal stress protein [Phragmitibacter flavus]
MSILSCTDGSNYSPSVYDHTAWVAQRTQASIHVLHTLDPHRESASLADLSGSLMVDAQQALLAELVALDEAKSRVARLRGDAILAEADRHLRATGLTNIHIEQRHGTLVDTVAEYTPTSELLVIGKRGKSADFATMHLGGNLERIIRSAHQPVLVTSRSFRPIDKFLLAFDGGPSAEKAVTYAINQPLLQGLTCHLYMAGISNAQTPPAFENAAQKLSNAGYQVIPHLNPGEPEEGITATLKSAEIPLLVMGAYGHTRIRHLLLGSTTTTMVRTCLVSVLMFR